MKLINYINSFITLFLLFAICYLYYEYIRIKNIISNFSFESGTISQDKYDFMLREIDNNYILITVTITLLFGLTAFFVSFNSKRITEDAISDLKKNYDEYRTNQKVQEVKMHKLEGDLNMSVYNGLRLNAEFLLDKDEDYHETSQYYLAMVEKVALAIGSYKSAGYDFDNSYYEYIKEDLSSLKEYVDSVDSFIPDHLSYDRYITLKKNIDSVVDIETSKLLHDIGSKISFRNLLD